jgi:hypothetical protein
MDVLVKQDRARKRELNSFIDRMTSKFAGVDDEHLLRWVDRLLASEPPVAGGEQEDQP